MAVVKPGQYGIDMSDFKLGTLRDDYPTVKDANFFRVEWEFASYYDFYGKGFKYDANGMPTSGTITGFGIGDPDGPFFTVKGLSLSPKELMDVAWSETHSDDDKLIRKIFAGADSILGGKTNDYESGFGGNDKLRGGGGTDVLVGGAGVDTFVFSRHYGTDTIQDFSAKGSGHDIIDLSHLPLVKNFADLIAHHVSDSGEDLVIAAGADTLTLHHVSRDDLSKADFIF